MRSNTSTATQRRMIALLGARAGDRILHIGPGRGNRLELPFPSEAFDRVLTVDTIHFWPALEPSLQEIRRVLKAGGTLAVGYRPTGLLRRLAATQPGFMPISDDDLLQALGGSGFEVVALELGEAGGPGYACAVALATEP